MKIKYKNIKFTIQAFLVLTLLIFFLFLKSTTPAMMIECYTHWCCGKTGPKGCSYSPFSNDFTCNCDGTTLYCDRGECGTCTPSSCPTGYTTTNTGCSTTQTSCTRRDCHGTCGTTYRTCYLLKYTLTYTAGSNGYITGTTPQSVCRGSNGSSVTANPNGGYHFVNWSDSSTANPRTDTSVTASKSVTANFAINQYTVTFDGNGGSCSPSSEVINYGSNSSVPSCTRTGYYVKIFSRTAGSGGTLNTTTGQVTSVTGTQTIQPTWELSNLPPTAPTSLLTEEQTNPTDVTNITPEFSAIYNDPDTSDTSSYYEIEINTSSDFTGTVMLDSGKTAMTTTSQGSRSPNIVYNGTTLIYDGTTYYWRIKFWDNSDAEGSWSSTANFTMDIPTSSYYEIEVNTASDFTGTVMWDTGKTSMTATTAGQRSPTLTYSGSTLSEGVTYYWRIRFWDMVDNVSPWSDTSNFKLNNTPTPPTSLLTEGENNPSDVLDTTPEFSAIYNDSDTSDTSSYYQIQVNTTSTFDGTTMWDSTKTSMTITNQGNRSSDISYAGSALSYNVTYYWRIKFWDSVDSESPWSSTANFKLNRTPTTPTVLLTEGQTNPTTIKDTTPEFSAIFNDPDSTDISSYYEIEVNTSSDFTETVMWDSSKTSMTTTNQGDRSPDISYAGSTLSESITYYWRIKFWDSVDNESPWSSIANFQLQYTPTASELLIMGETNPSHTYFDVYFSAIYTDPNSDDSSNYEIEVNTTSDFTGTVMWDSTKTSATITSGNRSSDISYAGTELSYDGTTYYVRMKFWDIDDNESEWVTGQFTDTLKSFQLNGLQMNGLQLN